jgi:hypothetical protein
MPAQTDRKTSVSYQRARNNIKLYVSKNQTKENKKEEKEIRKGNQGYGDMKGVIPGETIISQEKGSHIFLVALASLPVPAVMMGGHGLRFHGEKKSFQKRERCQDRVRPCR